MAVDASPSAASLAKGAQRRLAQAQQEPTPDNYARAYAEEAGQPPPVAAGQEGREEAREEARAQGQAWAALAERLVRNLERGGKQWSGARRKDSLKRVFDGSRSDAQRLQQRLQSLMTAWETDAPSDPAQTGMEDLLAEAPAATDVPAGAGAEAAAVAGAMAGAEAVAWRPVLGSLHGSLGAALPPALPQAVALADQLAALADALAADGPTPERAAEVEALCVQARRLFQHRHHLVDELSALCRELSAGLVELAEDDSWARGQCEALQHTLALDETPSVRGERQAARDALRQLIHVMVVEVGELGDHAGRFQLATAQHVEAIEGAESLENLAEVVKALLQDARTVQSAVGRSQQKLQADQTRAGELEARVRELEIDLRRLSEEVSTDALTQVANRRGLDQAFEVERARCEREAGAALAVGLIDIDNFKKLNDSLGHAAGDTALKALAAAVRERLRPVDHLARFGGEEFVVLLPGLPVDDAQQVMTRLQRSLSEALFLHDGREVFVTFSGGVTGWRPGESLQVALERADAALYEAKRTGKNRTCTG